MRASLTLLFLFSTLILSAQIQNGGLDQWEEAFHPTHPYFDLVEWKTSNRGSSTPTIDPTPDTSVTKIIQNGRIFAKI